MRESTINSGREQRGRRWSDAEGRAFVESWRASGQSQVEFCRSKGIGLQRLRYWLDRSQGSVSAPSAVPEFVVVPWPQAGPAQASSPRWEGVEVLVGAGIVVRVAASSGHQVLAEVLRAALAVVS